MAPSSDASSPLPPTDRLLACCAGLAALALYTWTLLPGLGGPEDTPKFQLLGAALGTAHAPGYPLYILVAHAFSWIPLGTPAWRANFASACFGALTIGVLYVVFRRLGASRAGSLALAVGAAAGRYFWWNSIVAEVYTLAAALHALSLERLIRWSATRAPRDFYAAIGWSALALGNHLSIVAIVPAFVVFALVVDWRFALRPKTLAIAVGLVALGLSTYLFIVIRTLQRAAFLESRIRSFSEFWYTLRGGRFEDLMFTFDLATLITTRVPMAAGLLLDEFTWPGLVLIVSGAVIAVRRDPSRALLLGLGAASAVFLAINLDSDQKGFLVPAFVMTWPLAAFALGTARHPTSRVLTPSRLALVLAAAVPIAGLVANFPVNNLRHERYFATYFDSLIEWLPPTSAFVYETYEIDAMLHYQATLDSRGKRIRHGVRHEAHAIDPLLAEGRRLFAFPRAGSDLEALGYPLVPVTLPGEDLADWIAASSDTLAIAGVWPGLADALGISPVRGAASALQSHVVIVRTPHGPPEISTDSRPVSRDLSNVLPGLSGVLVESLPFGGGRLSRGGVPLLRTDAGVILAVFSQEGRLTESQLFPPGAALRRRLDTARLRLNEVMPRSACESIGDRVWTDVSRLDTTGSFRFTTNSFRAFDSTIVLYVGGGGVPADPRIANPRGSGEATVHVEQFDVDAREALARRLRDDGVPDALAPREAAVSRVEVRVNDRGDAATLLVGLGTHGRTVIARGMADRPEDWRILVCEAPLPPLASARLELVDFYLGAGSETAFPHGWRTPDPDREGPTRWMAAGEAAVRGTVDQPAPVTLHLEIMPREPGATLDLAINGTPLGAVTLAGGWQHLTWAVPQSAWRAGINDVQLETSLDAVPAAGDPDRRHRTIAVRRWVVERSP